MTTPDPARGPDPTIPPLSEDMLAMLEARARTVRHTERPDLGVGTIRGVVQPDVVEVVWEKRTDTGRRVWGYYRVGNLVPVRAAIVEAPG